MTSGIRLMLPLIFGALGALSIVAACLFADSSSRTLRLPEPAKSGRLSLEEVLANRRSVRHFKDTKLTRQQIAQLCWAAQGVTDAGGPYRTCPSAGALYPLEIYVVTAEGVARYVPKAHAMVQQLGRDVRAELQAAALDQPCVGQAAATFVIAAVVARTERKYGRRAMRYVLIEAGHAGQNILLQAEAMGLAAVPVGAFNDAEVAKVLPLPPDHTPLYLIPVGAPQTE